MNAVVQREIELLRTGYKLNPKLILQNYIQENEKIQGYRGRELLELLQNAVDELEGASKKTVQIMLTDKTLSVSNNGRVFSEDGVISLMYSNLSPKYQKNQYIGNKGTGFRSILNWANSVSIFSGSLSIEFNPEYAEEELERLLEDENVSAYKATKPDLRMATLVAPKIVNNINDHEFDTTIRIELIDHDEIRKSVKQQLSELDIKFLLFLENLEHLIIIDHEDTTEYIKRPSAFTGGDAVVSITKTVNGEIESVDEWHLAHNNGKIEIYSVEKNCTEEKSYNITIAYKRDMSVKADNLYSFFRTDVSFPVPALVHGTFDLTENRNHLIKNEANELVLSKTIHLLIDVAKKLAEGEVSYLPLQLLAITVDFPNELSWGTFDFNTLYRNTVEESDVFPTVNSNYISFNDSPKFYKHNLADYLSGDKFNGLLVFTQNIRIRNFIASTATKRKYELKYIYADVVTKIDSVLPRLTIKERAACCAAFLAEYESEITNKFPVFMLDTAGDRVDNSHNIFLQPERVNEFSEPPAFANIRYLNLELRRAFENVFETRAGRALEAKLGRMKVQEYNLTTIIQNVVSKLRNKDNKGSKKTRSKCVSTVKWLWNNRAAISELNLKNVGILLVARDGVMRNAEMLYWGKEYRNNITEDLFVERNDLFVSDPSLYHIADADIDEFMQFFSTLGVAKYPRLIFKKEIKISAEYLAILKEKMIYPVTTGYDRRVYHSEEEIRKDNAYYVPKINTTVIEHFEEILSKASTKAIISWLKSDINASALVSSEWETGSSCAYLDKGGWSYYRDIPANKVWCYMRYEFYTSKWIEVSGKRCAPSECILFNKVADKLLSAHIIAPNLEDYVVNINKKAHETSDTKDLLIKMGVADEFSKLTASQFYDVLLELPAIDASGELSRSLYTSIISAKGLEDKNRYLHTASFIAYMESGKVFCKDAKGFVSIKETYYLREKTVSREVLRNFNIVDIPNRQSKETIEAYLGVKPFPLKGKIEGTPVYHKLDHDFIQDFKNYIIYALCYRIKNTDEIYKFKSLKIRLCENIIANYGDTTDNLRPYAYIKGLNNEVCLKAPPNIKDIPQLKADLDFCASIAEIVTSTIDIQEATLFSRLRELYNYDEVNRRKVLLQEYDGFDILLEARDIFNYTQSQKEQFISACEFIGGVDKRISVEPLIDKLNFDDLNSVDNGIIIIKILTALEVDIAEFNEKSEFSIDMIPFHESVLARLTEQNMVVYKNKLYESLIDKPVEAQERFLKEYYLFGQFDFDVQNTAYFKANEVFYSQWAIINEDSKYDADGVYRTNRDLFVKDKEIIIVEDLLKSAGNDSLLYFGNFDALNSRYDVCKETHQKEVATENALKSSQKTFVATLQNVDVTAPKANTEEPRRKTPQGNRNTGMGKQRSNEDWGLYAERSVYRELIRLYGKKSVKWVSENARKDNVNPDGGAGYGYDIKYTDTNGKVIFVEVKSAKGSDLNFIITENELRFAEQNAKYHEIILVTDIENEPITYRLQNIFAYADGESRSENSRFVLSLNGSYTIQCEINNSQAPILVEMPIEQPAEKEE